MERWDDLQTGGLRILQDTELFCYSTDAVLLADFAQLRSGEQVLDLGAGCGILPLLMYAREPSATFTAVELQPPLYNLFCRSVQANHLENSIFPVLGDIRKRELWLSHSYDVCVCNPPYEKADSGRARQAKTHDIARKEIAVTFAEICACAAAALRSGGRFYFCIRPDRLQGVCCLLRDVRLEVKLLQMVHAKTNREAKLCLCMAAKDAHEGLRIRAPLFLYTETGNESRDLIRIYQGDHCGS